MKSELPRVMYLICASHVNAGGGHFYSLVTLIESLKNLVAGKVVNIGLVKVNTLPEENLLGFIPIFKYSIFQHFSKLLKITRKFRPDVIHAFDERSLYVAKILSYFINCPVVYTKCGGVNGSKFIPYADASIFFSVENQNHYLKYRKFKSEFHLIPNRSLPLEQDFKRQSSLKERIGDFSGVTILRISRFNKYYELTFKQSFQLLKVFEKSGYRSRLIFLGKVQDVDFLNELQKEIKSEKVIYVTDDEFTQNASGLIGVADVVIGTGRGVMEAASLSLPIYCPNSASITPVLLKKNRVEALLAKNFSERYVEENAKIEISLDGKDSAEAFNDFFDIRNVTQKYEKIYKNIKKKNKGIINFIMESLWFFRPAN